MCDAPLVNKRKRPQMIGCLQSIAHAARKVDPLFTPKQTRSTSRGPRESIKQARQIPPQQRLAPTCPSSGSDRLWFGDPRIDDAGPWRETVPLPSALARPYVNHLRKQQMALLEMLDPSLP